MTILIEQSHVFAPSVAHLTKRYDCFGECPKQWKHKGEKTTNGEGEEASKTLKWDPNTDSQFINYILIIMWYD